MGKLEKPKENGGLMGFYMGFYGIYLLVICYITIENGRGKFVNFPTKNCYL